MSDLVPNRSSTPSDRIARHAARFDACWPSVHVESVQVTSGLAGELARAVVQLGGLAPADVRVELMPAGAGTAPLLAGHDEERMFSIHALDNGCFVFEATLPHRDTGQPEEWLIHVHPSEALEEPRVEHRFRLDA
jgi:hypothetical protein